MTPDEFRVPDVVGEIVGWRAWRVIGSNVLLPMLASVSHGNTIWHPDRWTLAYCGRNGERCRHSQDGGVPGEGCSCGMYAARDRAHLVSLGYNRGSYQRPVFIGEVGLAGKVIPGQQGYRAAKARIVRLFVPYEHFRYVRHLEQLYRVPVLLDNTFREESLSHGDR